MKNSFKSRNLYKLIIFIFLTVAIVKIKGQLTTLKVYNTEIDTLTQKIATLETQIDEDTENLINSREDNEDIARKNLRMYYPNETPYKGY